MNDERKSKGQDNQISYQGLRHKSSPNNDFVLEKSIFSNIFEKDIKRIYIYKKAERLAKAIHLITPAFADSVSLRNRMDAIAIGLVDAAILPPGAARTALARELLTLSSVLSIARTGGLLSTMNAELIAHESHLLLQEVAAYEEPRLFLDDVPTLADIAKYAGKVGKSAMGSPSRYQSRLVSKKVSAPQTKGHVKDIKKVKDIHIGERREAILSVIRRKGGSASIKDISTVIRNVSEKTIQRELLTLIDLKIIIKKGERRWSTYSLLKL